MPVPLPALFFEYAHFTSVSLSPCLSPSPSSFHFLRCTYLQEQLGGSLRYDMKLTSHLPGSELRLWARFIFPHLSVPKVNKRTEEAVGTQRGGTSKCFNLRTTFDVELPTSGIVATALPAAKTTTFKRKTPVLEQGNVLSRAAQWPVGKGRITILRYHGQRNFH